MADATTTTATEPATASTAKPTAPEGKPPSPAEVDWQAKFTNQQKVNRDLEEKYNSLRDSQKTRDEALAKALGVTSEETSDVTKLAGQVTTLQEEFAKTQHQNVVLSVANEHGISDKDDLALLADAKDEEAVRRLAARIAKASEAAGSPHTPKPDLTQGGKGQSGQGGTPADDFARIIQAQLSR